LLQRLSRDGVAAYIDEQLDPEPIGEPGNARLASLLAQIPAPSSEHDEPTLEHLVAANLARAIYARAQLREQMVDFWETHFSTDFGKLLLFFGGDYGTASYFEFRENAIFRERALGRFEDLLLASATSPAMIIYLDSVQNQAGLPNENYARELLELHCFGVHNGYTETDIEVVARCFTGWTVCRVAPGSVDDPHAPCDASAAARFAFHFDPLVHDGGEKTIFAGTSYELHLPARSGMQGLQDGLDLIAHLARAPQTAAFVSSKLIERFVSDQVDPGLLASCTATWQATDGDLRAVLRAIFESPQFLAPSQRWSQVRSPLESVCSTVRALEGVVPTPFNLSGVRSLLDGPLSQRLFRWIDPDGYPESSAMQLGTSKMLGRIAFNQTIYAGGLGDPQYDLRQLLLENGVPPEDPSAIADFFLNLFFQENFSAQDREQALAFLATDEQGQPAALNQHAVDYPTRLKQFAAFVASFPQALAK
jgi:uncharacterized protein (DUF1800 family)